MSDRSLPKPHGKKDPLAAYVRIEMRKELLFRV